MSALLCQGKSELHTALKRCRQYQSDEMTQKTTLRFMKYDTMSFKHEHQVARNLQNVSTVARTMLYSISPMLRMPSG